MSTTVYTLSLARSANGNWSLTMPNNPTDLPPMAFPASMSPSEAQDYAAALLQTARVPAPESLAWHVYGRTRSESYNLSDAYRAAWSVSVQSLSPAL